MTEYTIGLALEDFLPVIFSSIGLFLLSRLIGRVDQRLGQMARIGWLLVTIGGFLKATWKFMMAVTEARVDIVWMDKGMFLWMAVGFTLLASALWFYDEKIDARPPVMRVWIVPGIILALTFGAILLTGFPDFAIDTWRFILLGMMTLANVIMIVLLIRLARRRQQNLAALFLLITVVITFVLSGMARMPEQTIPLQWSEQLLNTVAQGGFAYAVWALYETAKESYVGRAAVA